jgi:osmotically inducible lipoprotein OsmB
MRPASLLIALTPLLVAGRAPLDRTSGDRALTGTAVGAAAGAAVGLLGGGLLGSTVTGAVAGAAGGLVYDQMKKGGH